MLATIGPDHLARDHLEAAPLVPVAVAQVAAVNADDNRTRRRRRRLACTRDGMRLHDLCPDPQRPVAHRAGVLCSADRQQLGQEVGGLAERHERGIPRRDVGQLGRHRILAEVERGDALRPALTPAGADEHAPHPHRHLAEQGAEPRPVVALARQLAPARFARARALA
jgi:hypothetical protein